MHYLSLTSFTPRASIASASGKRQGSKLADQGGGGRAHPTINKRTRGGWAGSHLASSFASLSGHFLATLRLAAKPQLYARQLKGGLVTHLGYAAQSNEDSTKCRESEVATSSRSRIITQSAPKVHFQPFPTIDGIACKCIHKQIKKKRTSMYTIIYMVGN